MTQFRFHTYTVNEGRGIGSDSIILVSVELDPDAVSDACLQAGRGINCTKPLLCKHREGILVYFKAILLLPHVFILILLYIFFIC